MWLVESSASALIVVLDGLHNILRLPQERKKKSSYDDLLQQRYQDSNLGMTESESVALPAWRYPCGGYDGTRTCDLRIMSAML